MLKVFNVELNSHRAGSFECEDVVGAESIFTIKDVYLFSIRAKEYYEDSLSIKKI